MAVVPVAKSEEEKEALRQKIIANFEARQQQIIEDGEAYILETLGDAEMAHIEQVTQLFDSLTVDFACSVGKVGSPRSRSRIRAAFP